MARAPRFSIDGPNPEIRARSKANSIRRMGALTGTADAAEYLTGDPSGYVSDQHLLRSGEAPA